MCLQDLWIARHTIAKRLPPNSSYTLGRDLRRLGIVVASGGAVSIVNSSSETWLSEQSDPAPNLYTITMTNAVPPAGNTGTSVPSTFAYAPRTFVLMASQYGSLITDGCTITSASGALYVTELIADAALDKMLMELETKEGWPLYGLKGLA